MKTVLANFLVLEQSVAMMVDIVCVPKQAVEFPNKVDEFVNPEVTGDIMVINGKG